jgi:hypothetical protein
MVEPEVRRPLENPQKLTKARNNVIIASGFKRHLARRREIQKRRQQSLTLFAKFEIMRIPKNSARITYVFQNWRGENAYAFTTWRRHFRW